METARSLRKMDSVVIPEPMIVFNHNHTEYREKLLCDGIVFDLGAVTGEDAGHSPEIEDVRRMKALKLLEAKLLEDDGTRRYPDDQDHRVAFCSSMADAGANLERLRDTAAACNLILKNTGWQIRLLSRSHLLQRLISDEMIPEHYHDRLIFGFSMGTLEDEVAACIEPGTSLVSERIKSLRWLQDQELRTFVMIAPSLPEGSDRFHEEVSQQICSAIRVEKCEHVWGEVIHVRGASLNRILQSLREARHDYRAQWIEEISVSGRLGWPQKDCNWPTFFAHSKHIPADKLRFVHNVEETSADWWAEQREIGAVLVGKTARQLNLITSTPLSVHDNEYLMERERIVTDGVRASIAAAKALFEIYSHEDGCLWNREFPSFEAYCLARWDYKKAHSYRLVKCGGFVADLEKGAMVSQSPIGDWLPVNECQFRSMELIPKELKVPFWWETVAETRPSELTPGMMTQKMKRYLESRRLDSQQGSSVKADDASDASGGLEAISRPAKKRAGTSGAIGFLKKLRRATSKHGKGSEISVLLDQVEALIV